MNEQYKHNVWMFHYMFLIPPLLLGVFSFLPWLFARESGYYLHPFSYANHMSPIQGMDGEVFGKHNLLHYNPHQTQVAVNISQAAYCMNPFSEWDCKTCDANNIYENLITKNGMQVILGYNQEYGAIFIGYRGSENIQNWISNLQVSKIFPYSNNGDENIALEKGFYNLFQSLKPNIYSAVNNLVNKYHTNQLFITGHSLGAALATINAFDVKYQNEPYQIFTLTTFGSPRVGNAAFVDAFSRYGISSIRVTHYYDIVPHVPENFLDYYHVSQEVWYNEANSDYTLCSDGDNKEDPYCSDSCAPTKCTSISDHMNYVKINMGEGGDCW